MAMMGGTAMGYVDAGPNRLNGGKAPPEAPDRALQAVERRAAGIANDLGSICARLEGVASRLHGNPAADQSPMGMAGAAPVYRGDVPGIHDACSRSEDWIKRLFSVCEHLDAL